MRPPDRSCVECSTLVIKVSRVVDLLFFFVVFMIFLFHQRHVDMAAARSKGTRAMLRSRNWLFAILHPLGYLAGCEGLNLGGH